MRLFLLFLIPLVFSASQITLEREWLIEDSPGSVVDFQGALVVNNSNQNVLSVESDQELFEDEFGGIWVRFKDNLSSEKTKLSAKAVVAVDYHTNIFIDPPLSDKPIKSTNLTTYDESISAKARELSDNSSLKTIANLVNWVHSSIEYDESYWGQIKSAKETFNEKKGVCVQYTHLMISMANSLGFQTRYVAGYVYVDDWQPHIWAEIYVPSYGWLPADPTYAQVGLLDDSHVAISYGNDQVTTYDSLLSKNPESILNVTDKLSLQFTTDEVEDHLSMSFDKESKVIRVSISNDDSYLFGTYTFQNPYVNKSEVLLLKPKETINKYYGLNRSLVGSSYSIPVFASFNEETEKKVFVVEDNFICPPFLFLLLLLRGLTL